ncbi:MAG: hypothetical protein V4561_09885 [Bacteroidota bacterium]
MKNLVIGIILGIVISAVGGYLAFPKFKKAAYDEGFAVGNTEGVKTGTAAGIEEGIAQGAAKQMAEQKHVADSLSAVITQHNEVMQKARRKPVEKKPEIENWRVLGGQIGEPIIEEKEVKKEEVKNP